MDFTKALLSNPIAAESAPKSMKRGKFEVVARDGIEPPTPAFSGPPADPAKWFEISVCC